VLPEPAVGEEASSSTNVPEALKPKAPLAPEVTAARAEACLLMRWFAWGKFGYEDTAEKDRESILQESLGTKGQVMQLNRLWCKLDKDNSGRVDILEFRKFVEDHIREMIKKHKPAEKQRVPPEARKKNVKRGTMYTTLARQPTMAFELRTDSAHELLTQAIEETTKFMLLMCEKLSTALLGKKSSFAIEDMMRLIWLPASAQDAKTMRQWIREFIEDAIRHRVDTPPVLDDVEHEALCAVFAYFDDERQGQILFDTLVTKGLIYTEQVDEYRMLWDSDGNGNLSLEEFCDMMCPVGFRATAQSEVGSQADGKRVIYDNSISSWKFDELFDEPVLEVGTELTGKESMGKEASAKESAGKEVAGQGQDASADDFLQ
jgi:Ca2+-binding EF-hand superfamily protein